MIYKNLFPFKIGSTSYAFPDSIVPNVIYMSEFVDDVELLFFESLDNGSILATAEINELQSISSKHNIQYSIHCPIDLPAGSSDPFIREKFINQVEMIINLTKTLPVSGFIIHLEGINNESNGMEISEWNENVILFCKKISSINGLVHSKICIETLSYNPKFNEEIVNRYGFSHCIDIGHMWLHNHNWETICPLFLPKTRIIHLHGIQNDKDHRSLAMHDKSQLNKFIKTSLKDYSGVVTIELFDKNIIFNSLNVVKELWDQ